MIIIKRNHQWLVSFCHHKIGQFHRLQICVLIPSIPSSFHSVNLHIFHFYDRYSFWPLLPIACFKIGLNSIKCNKYLNNETLKCFGQWWSSSECDQHLLFKIVLHLMEFNPNFTYNEYIGYNRYRFSTFSMMMSRDCFFILHCSLLSCKGMLWIKGSFGRDGFLRNPKCLSSSYEVYGLTECGTV
jgi:hypothetical protein